MSGTGRVAVVTGAASGIGAATARLLAQRGVRVVGLDIDPAGLHTTIKTIKNSGGQASGVEVDVSDQAAVTEAVTAATESLDIVVNCAASFVARGLGATREDWDRILGVNVRGISNVVQAAYPLLRRSEDASVVNTSSISAHIGQPDRWTYNATKGAILTLTKCMAMDLAPDKIRVNAVSPGWIWTPEVARAADGDRERWEPVWGRFHLLGRLGEPEEVARAIAFLSSSEASFITGAELPVDGGYLAMGPEGTGGDSSFAGSA